MKLGLKVIEIHYNASLTKGLHSHYKKKHAISYVATVTVIVATWPISHV
jgi:predicted nuclease with RNAse H fold